MLGVRAGRYLAASTGVVFLAVLLSVLSRVAIFTVVPYLTQAVDYPFGPAVLFSALGALFLALIALPPGGLIQWLITVLVGRKLPAIAPLSGAVAGLGASLALVLFITIPSADLGTGVWLALGAAIQTVVLFLVARFESRGSARLTGT